MKSATIVSAIVAASLGCSSLAFAQNRDDRHGLRHDAPRVVVRGGPVVVAPGTPVVVAPRGYGNHPDARNDRHFGARGPQFHRGGYIPREYRNRQYYVNDWRTHRLAAPGRGYQWVQVGADYALIAIATGLIAQMVLSH